MGDERGEPAAREPEIRVELDWPETVGSLETLRDELETILDEVAEASAALSAPLEARLKAIRAFDREYRRGARLLERTFEEFGLPTLAMAVRPHLKGTGRVGRPSKRPPVDAYPDLVAQVRAAGLLPEPAPAAEQAEETARRQRRRIVHRVPSLEPVASPPRRRRARRQADPEKRAKLAARKRRRRSGRRVWLIRQDGRATPHRLVQGPRPRQREGAGRKRSAPWAARALDWWQHRRDAV